MSIPCSKPRSATAQELRQAREDLGWTQHRLAEEVLRWSRESISVSTIKQYEQSTRPPSPNTVHRVRLALRQGALERQLADLEGIAQHSAQLFWAPDYSPLKTHQIALLQLAQNEFNGMTLTLNPQIYLQHKEIVNSGRQGAMIKGRSLATKDIIENLYLQQQENYGVDVISLCGAWGWFDIQLATEIAAHLENQKVRLIIISPSPYVMNQATEEIISSVRPPNVVPCLVLGYHENLSACQAFFSSGPRRRIFLMLPPTTSQDHTIELVSQVGRVSRPGDYLLIEFTSPFGTCSDAKRLGELDVRSNGQVDMSFADPINLFFKESLLNLLKKEENLLTHDRIMPIGPHAADQADVDVLFPPAGSPLLYDYKVHYSLKIFSEHSDPKDQTMVQFVRMAPAHMIAFLHQAGWHHVSTFDWGYDYVPKYPNHLLLLRRI